VTTIARDSYVAFIDVLGFSNIVESEFDRIVEAYEGAFDVVKHLEAFRPDVKLSIFSDAIILRSSSFDRIVGAVQMVLWQTLFNDLMVRGGVGFVRHDEKMKDGQLQIVSQALVRAARIEKRVKHPCVVVDPAITLGGEYWPLGVPNLHRGLLYFDSLRIINPCNVLWGSSAMTRAWQLREKYPEHASKYDWFLRLCQAICEGRPMIPPEFVQHSAYR
jgi:hypothetical protein